MFDFDELEVCMPPKLPEQVPAGREDSYKDHPTVKEVSEEELRNLGELLQLDEAGTYKHMIQRDALREGFWALPVDHRNVIASDTTNLSFEQLDLMPTRSRFQHVFGSAPDACSANAPSAFCEDRGGDVLEAPAERVSRWNKAAVAFVDMLLTMQATELRGGRGWMEGIGRLILFCTPKCQHLGFDEFAGNLLRDKHLLSKSDQAHPWFSRFVRLNIRIETICAEATKYLNLGYDWTLWPGTFGERARQKARKCRAQDNPPFGGFGWQARGLLFIGLPLSLYLSDSPHLYELVDRLRSLANIPGAQMTPAFIRSVLEYDGQPYGVLAYAIIAALQALNSARLPNKKGAEGLEALSATAVTDEYGGGWVSVASDQFGGAQPFKVSGGDFYVSGSSNLIFRGIWVPSVIDEHLARYTWSFNSFSRSLEGVLWVLDFYASGGGKLAETAALSRAHSHVLLYVARFRGTSGQWSFPVQQYNSGAAADIEKEVMVPPFMHYVFEEDACGSASWTEIKSTDSVRTRQRRLERIEERWGMRISKEAPLLLELLKGGGSRNHKGLDRDIKITLRFISRMEPAEPLQKLFGDRHQSPEELLLAFPPEGDVSGPVQSPFGAGMPELLNGYVASRMQGVVHDKWNPEKSKK